MKNATQCRARQILGMAMIAFMASAVSSLKADLIPYPNIGSEAPLNTFLATGSGPITAYFYATDAAYDSEIGLLVNGVSTGVFGLLNHSSVHGQSLVLGNANAGDTLVFQLFILTIGSSWFSDPSLNGGDGNHVYATPFSGDSFIPAGTYIAFEDLPLSVADKDYNDHQFVVTGVSNNVPEPSTNDLLLYGACAGILLGLRCYRREFRHKSLIAQ